MSRPLKVTPADCEAMKAMRAAGMKYVDIAAHFKCSSSTVFLHVTGKRQGYVRTYQAKVKRRKRKPSWVKGCWTPPKTGSISGFIRPLDYSQLVAAR